MKKTYKVKVIPGAGEAQVLDVASSSGVGSTTINAVANGRYQLIDVGTGGAPDNIRTRRQGNDLQVYFEGREQADLVIADYFADSANNTLMGEAQNGVFHPYIPESGEWTRSLPQMADGAKPVGMALGSEPLALAEFAPSSLVVAAGISPLWGAPLLLLGAGGGGKGGSSSGTAPIVKVALLFAGDDTGFSSSDGITRNNTPRIAGDTDPNAAVKILVNGHVYAGTADAQGHFMVPITDALPDGVQNYKVQVTNVAGNITTVDGTPFTIDTAAPSATGALFGSDDTGTSPTDNITQINTPRISGDTDPNASVKITVNGHGYSDTADAQGHYLVSITDALPDGVQNYKVEVTDAAGNTRSVDGQSFTVDTSSASTSQGVSLRIDAITQDTGWNPNDFITGDNTLSFQGALIENNLAKFNANDWVQLQLLDAQSHVVGSRTLKPTLNAGVWQWTWSNEASVLDDGAYTLQAQLIDTAGNTLSQPWAFSQKITVDTQAQKLNGQNDPNANFVPHITQLVQDTGSSAHDNLTKDRELSFTGNVTSSVANASFHNDTGRVLAEIIDANGQIVAMQYLQPASTGDWTFDNRGLTLGVANQVNTYTLKTAVVDNAGHFMHATSQAFTIDLQAPQVSNPGSTLTAGGFEFTKMDFTANERGTYFFNDVAQTGNTLDLAGQTHFEVGQFKVVFVATAGNEWTKTNSQVWDFQLTQPISLAAAPAGPAGFEQAQTVGSVGKYTLVNGQNLDASSLYALTPALQAKGGVNHFVMGDGAQTLTLSIGDVLELGISNSFANSLAFKDHLQMRVDGDSADRLLLSKQWANSTGQSWSADQGQLTLDGQTYNVYRHTDLALDVFVQASVQVTLI